MWSIIINPTQEQAERSSWIGIVAGTKQLFQHGRVCAKELSEEIMLEALLEGHEVAKNYLSKKKFSGSW